MAIETVEVLVEGGKATAAPPIGPALGPLGLNIGQVVADINTKTADFKGMKVPVKIEVNSETKNYNIVIGTPPTAELIKSELKLKKGSGKPSTDFVADITIEQVQKIARMKTDALLGKTMKEKSKEVMGTCRSLGITVEGMKVADAVKKLNEGGFDSKF